MIVIARLVVQLDSQLPAGLQVVPDVDLDLQLASPAGPGWSRRPDLLIVAEAAAERVRTEGGLLRASEVLVVIEVVSPGSKRTDHVIKRAEYADAGVPRYWIIDLDDPFTLIDCQLAEGLGYQDSGAHAGQFSSEIINRDLRYPVLIRLDRLLRR
jgi:Uma2 family endonuclease